ncbi:UbiX family flavin prenyltransferase [Saccharothrix australiensis]|uniref:Flavin prenyltransferase UbiX n=1 Tax=Saccharothrix australiensis TaxID=2072 RepID=A0A495VWP5_9PSEU|nr:UbiX family flavin prenyltransferase [Saccharothrix australiensis]RKT53831.1 4-hydroxy-3-polyprenylbenzoate decarboxylase [Saccharothrix australiensis]
MDRKRVVVGITGASGVVYGVRALELLAATGVETHLVLTRQAQATVAAESELPVADIKARADVVHSDGDLGAAVSSGSFPVTGMLIAPCSVKTLSGIANSYDDNLVVRAADVTLKERRPLVLLVRETPLHLGHLRLMCAVAEIGAVVMPPVPAFYNAPRTIGDLVDYTVVRALDLLGCPVPSDRRWAGTGRPDGRPGEVIQLPTS